MQSGCPHEHIEPVFAPESLIALAQDSLQNCWPFRVIPEWLQWQFS
jgi:hypothetical protein